MRVAFLALLIVSAIPAQAGSIDTLKAEIEGLGQSCRERDRTDLKVHVPRIKLALRTLAEESLSGAARDVDTEPLQRGLTEQLQDAALPNGAALGCDIGEWGFGSVGIEIGRLGELVRIDSLVTIECGQDAASALYEWDGRRWARIWNTREDEVNLYPQPRPGIDVGKSGIANDAGHLVLLRRFQPSCNSVWTGGNFSLWRAGLNRSRPQLLIEREVGSTIDGLSGTLSPDGFTVDAVRFSLRKDYEWRDSATLHFSIRGDRVTRVDPIEESPDDFADQWAASPWSDSAAWSDRGKRRELHAWHRRIDGQFERELPHGCFAPPVALGGPGPSRWQVTYHQDRTHGSLPKDIHFLVRQYPPNRFRMADVSDKPWAKAEPCSDQ